MSELKRQYDWCEQRAKNRLAQVEKAKQAVRDSVEKQFGDAVRDIQEDIEELAAWRLWAHKMMYQDKPDSPSIGTGVDRDFRSWLTVKITGKHDGYQI